MKIAIISTLFQEKHQMNSGYYPLLYNIARKLSENIDITIFSSGWPRHPRKESIDNINIIRTASYGRSIAGLEYWPMCMHLKHILKNNYDIINGFGNDASIMFYLMNKLNTKKIKITSSMSLMRGWRLAVPYKTHFNSWLKMKRIEHYDNTTINNSDRIITLSNFAKDEILNIYSIDPDKIDIISPGIDIETFKPIKIEDSKYDDKIVIFFAGGISFRKGSDVLIAAYIQLKKRYKDLILIISGTDNLNRFEPILRKSELDPKKDIILLGNVPNTKMNYYFNLCDIYVHPSYHETFGVALIEAMACKKPVVTCNATAMPEVIGNTGILTIPGSIKDLTDKISHLIEDSKLRKNLGNNGRKRVLNNYTLENTINNYQKYYESISKTNQRKTT